MSETHVRSALVPTNTEPDSVSLTAAGHGSARTKPRRSRRRCRAGALWRLNWSSRSYWIVCRGCKMLFFDFSTFAHRPSLKSSRKNSSLWKETRTRSQNFVERSILGVWDFWNLDLFSTTISNTLAWPTPLGRAAWVRSPPTPTHKTCLLSAVGDLKWSLVPASVHYHVLLHLRIHYCVLITSFRRGRFEMKLSPCQCPLLPITTSAYSLLRINQESNT
jgi:hypothetical protein